MIARTKDALRRLQSAPEDFIVVFTHGRIMQTMRFLLERPALSEKELMAVIPGYCARMEIENCSVIQASADRLGVRLHENDRGIFEAGFTRKSPPIKKIPRLSPGNH